MKNIGLWNFYEDLNYQNFIFKNKNCMIGDDLLKPFNELYQAGKMNGLNFLTLDMVSDFNSLEVVIFIDFPKLSNPLVQKALASKAKKYLIIFETELIRKECWDLKNHDLFGRIYTWNDEYVDNKKYFKLNFPQVFPGKINKNINSKKLCTLIAGNKAVKHPLELYSKRKEAILWFEATHPNEFDLYGTGWDEYRFSGPRLINALNRIKWLTSLLGSKSPSYRGRIERKKPVLEKYRFAICYENARDIPGYITEKIFDCFFAGCVPIYWGASNIAEHIPQVCFIDKREFETYEELYNYINSMSDEEYIGYLDNIQNFLNSDQAYQFSSMYFVKTLIGAIVD